MKGDCYHGNTTVNKRSDTYYKYIQRTVIAGSGTVYRILYNTTLGGMVTYSYSYLYSNGAYITSKVTLYSTWYQNITQWRQCRYDNGDALRHERTCAIIPRTPSKARIILHCGGDILNCLLRSTRYYYCGGRSAFVADEIWGFVLEPARNTSK